MLYEMGIRMPRWVFALLSISPALVSFNFFIWNGKISLDKQVTISVIILTDFVSQETAYESYEPKLLISSQALKPLPIFNINQIPPCLLKSIRRLIPCLPKRPMTRELLYTMVDSKANLLTDRSNN